MAFKVLLFCALVAVVNCGIISVPTVIKKVELEAPAHYSFKYDVNDATTGDNHGQEENRNGDDVQGSYYLIDADGLKRIVDYKASEAEGFTAVVRREPAGQIVKKIVAAPTITKVISPAVYQHAPAVYHHAPAAHKIVAAPASHSTFTISSPHAKYGW